MSAESLHTAWLLLTSAAALLGCIGVLLLATKVRQLLGQDLQRQNVIQSLQQTVTGLNGEILENGRNRQQIEIQLKRLGIRQDQLELRELESRPFGHATNLVKKGAGVEDLMGVCGLTQGEAELIVTLHGLQQSPKALNSSSKRKQ